MPAGQILVQALRWAESKGIKKPFTLEEMLRVKDMYIEVAMLSN
jgi:hypothetical protein